MVMYKLVRKGNKSREIVGYAHHHPIEGWVDVSLCPITGGAWFPNLREFREWTKNKGLKIVPIASPLPC